MRAFVAAGLLIGLAAAGRADQESPGEVVARVVKELRSLESYRINATVKGGKAQGADHTVTEAKVDDSYQAIVVGRVCKLSAPCTAFRQRLDAAKGAVQEGTAWKAILATDPGRRSARLFPAPEVVLGRALPFKGKAQWVAPEGGGKAAAPADPEVDRPPEMGDDDSTRQREGKKGAATKSNPTESSHHIRIQAPPQVALETFLEVINSGCFTEG